MIARYLLPCLTLWCLLSGCAGDEPDPASPTDPAPARTGPYWAAAPEPEQLNYTTLTARVEDIRRTERLSGRVVPLQEATLASQMPGVVLPMDKRLQEGAYFREGEVLARIDNEQLRLGLRAERSEFVGALVGLLSTLSLDYPESFPTWDAFTNSIDPEQPLPELPPLPAGQLTYFLNARGIPARYYGIRATENLLEDYTVRAPFSGRLTRPGVEAGSFVNPGVPLATIARTDVYEIRAEVPASAASGLQPGQEIIVTTGSPGGDYTARVHRFGPTVDAATQSVVVFLRVSGKDLRPGRYVEATFPAGELRGVTELPKTSLARDGSVYVIRDGVIHAQPVDVALTEADRVFVRGLAAGETVISQQIRSTLVGTKAK